MRQFDFPAPRFAGIGREGMLQTSEDHILIMFLSHGAMDPRD